MKDLKFKSEGGWNQYIEWIAIAKLKFDYNEFSKYNALIWTLVDIPFDYSHPMDENRYNDGLGLRREFENLTEYILADEAGYKERCTVFEMMAALAARCENQIMRDVALGDRSKTWFLEMCKNLDILQWDFDHLQYSYKDDIKQKVYIWLSRKYEKDGKGSPFPLKNAQENQRNVQIWGQMNAYLMENFMDFDGLELFKA